jgi:4-hydroxybenzoate polyprenyltransferase
METPRTFVAPLRDDSALGRPLCVSLDGALLRTDVLWESLLFLVRKRPRLIFLLPIWMVGGRARLERLVTDQNALDATTLPYRQELIEWLREHVVKGRRVVLVGETSARIAQGVAEHLALFEEVITTDGAAKTDGADKYRTLEARFGAKGFDYVGSSDFAALGGAKRGYVVGASRSAGAQARRLGDTVEVLSTRPSRLKAMLKVMRPHQWSKNALVVVPVLLAPDRPTLYQLFAAAVAALAFSFCASAGYIFNDLLDVEADRAHRSKRFRPFASGDLPVTYGPPLFLLLLSASFGLAFAAGLPLEFAGMLALYFAATLAYSLVLKSKLMLDVVVLAWLYTHRVLAGGIATGIPISTWLLAFSMFMFSSLAFGKRYIELRHSMSKGGEIKSRGYHTQDLEMVASMGPTAGYLAVLVFCLYVDSNVVRERYRVPMLLWFVAPVLLYWISRVWFLAHRGRMQDDPVKFALTDPVSWLCGFLVAFVAGAARLWSR